MRLKEIHKSVLMSTKCKPTLNMAECVKNDITSFEMLLKRLVIFIANIEQ